MELLNLLNGIVNITMYKIIKSLFLLLSAKQLKNFYFLQIFVLIMAFTEILGVASIIPFMALVGDIDQLQTNKLLAKIYIYSGISSKSNFIFLLGLGVLLMLFISALISMFTIWRLSMFATKVGTEIADRLYSHYIKQDWLFHVSASSAKLTKKIAVEAGRVTGGIMMPLMQMNARLVLAFFMSLTIFIYDPIVAIIGLIIFFLAYVFLYKIVRYRLQKNGKIISQVNEERFRLMNEGFGGVKDLILLGRHKYFINRFNKSGNLFAFSQGTNASLTQVPRYFMELIAFGSIITLLLYLIVSHNGNLGVILPILSVYALAGFKLLPAFQQIYASIATIKANTAAFDSIKEDLINSNKKKLTDFDYNKEILYLNKQIKLENISFTYPGKLIPAINQLSIEIPANSVVGIVGSSGSGKSTLIDIIVGLLNPDQGKLKIDDKILDNSNRRAWQNSIGFVGQSIFLSEGTIAENVAFGISNESIDRNRIKKILKLTNLNELINNLEKGIDTEIGERGVRLSGGQRQRIGIARALYKKSEVLIFDEGTSSLDGITEKIIMRAIYELGENKTIILVAHRLQTVKKCKNIFMIEKGKLYDQGTFEELIRSNELFKKMDSNHSIDIYH